MLRRRITYSDGHLHVPFDAGVHVLGAVVAIDVDLDSDLVVDLHP